jgi:hypothetical protein
VASLPVFQHDTPFYKAILDAMPHPMLLMDVDVRIIECNSAGLHLFEDASSLALRPRGGDALHCINASKQGCGSSPACKRCAIREAVKHACVGNQPFRRAQRMELVKQRDKDSGCYTQLIHLLVTASPFHFCGQHLALLVLENISELITLREILPICSGCRKIRNDDAFWESVESYFKTRLDIEFSHGLCPDCLKSLYGDLSDPIQ